MNKTKRKIFETSMKLFAEKGYDATSIEEITSVVGVAKGTLYYHFSSKEEIFHFLVDEGMKLLQNSISIKTAQKEESSVLDDKYHEDDDLGVDFHEWSEYNSYAEDKNVIQFREADYYGNQYAVADFIDQNGNCVLDKIKDNYLEIPEAVEKIKGIVFNDYYYNTYINSDYIEESPDGKSELTVMRFKDLFNLEIADADVQKELPNIQDTLVLSNEFVISDDGTISLKEEYINE